MGVAFAVTFPGLVVLLVAIAFVDQALLRVRGRGVVPWRRHSQVSATGFDLLHAAMSPGKQHELDERHTQVLVREEDADGAPPRSRVDLVRRTAHLRLGH